MHLKHQLLFVQGGGKGVHDEWDSKLVKSLRRSVGHAYSIHYPRMPNEDDPSYIAWKAAIEKMFRKFRTGSILIGHSVGGTILLKVLAEYSSAKEFGAIFLIAPPFVGTGGWSLDDLRFPTDLGARIPKGVPIHFYQGLKDEVTPPSHVELYARAIPQAQVHRLQGRDHQLNDDLSEVAAEILAFNRRHLR